MKTLTQLLADTTARQSRHIAALSTATTKAPLLDTIAGCEGAMTALRALLAFPAETRRDHAVRLLCEAVRLHPTGNTLVAREAERDVYADVLGGRLNLV